MYSPARPRTEQQALIALGLAVASFVAAPIILAIAAIIVAKGARAKIEASDGSLTGEDYCRIAIILSWVNIVLGAVFLVIALIAFIGVLGHGSGSATFSL